MSNINVIVIAKMALSMSASADKGVSRAYTSIHLIGGADINAHDICDGLYSCRLPDLKTEGGAIFKGSVAVLGDMCIAGTVTGNIGGNLSGNLMGDISVEGDLDVGGNLTAVDGIIANLESDIVCINDELFVDMISPKTGTSIDLGNVVVDDITINGMITGNLNVDLSNVTSLTLEILTGNLVDANIVCVNTELQTDLIVPKTNPYISVGATILPTANITYDLGSVSSRWSNIYGNTIYTSFIDGLSPITSKTDLIPSDDLQFDLGIVSQRWKTICVGDIDNAGNLNGNEINGNNVIVASNITGDILIGNVVIADQVNGTGNGVVIEGVLALGSSLTANVIAANIGCFGEIKSNNPNQAILLSGNILPSQDGLYNIGSANAKIEHIYVNDITICGQILGNVNIDTGNIDLSNIANLSIDTLFANLVCANVEIQTDVINEKTGGSGVTVEGVIHQDSNVTADTISANIIEAGLFFDYKRTVVNTATYTMDQSDDIIAVKSTANGIVTLTLPLIDSMKRKRKQFAIVDEAGHAGANSIVITTTAPDKIFAGTSWMLSGDFNAVQIYSDESDNWFAI